MNECQLVLAMVYNDGTDQREVGVQIVNTLTGSADLSGRNHVHTSEMTSEMSYGEGWDESYDESCGGSYDESRSGNRGSWKRSQLYRTLIDRLCTRT